MLTDPEELRLLTIDRYRDAEQHRLAKAARESSSMGVSSIPEAPEADHGPPADA